MNPADEVIQVMRSWVAEIGDLTVGTDEADDLDPWDAMEVARHLRMLNTSIWRIVNEWEAAYYQWGEELADVMVANPGMLGDALASDAVRINTSRFTTWAMRRMLIPPAKGAVRHEP